MADAVWDDPDVEWAEPNQPRRLSGEPLAGVLWGLNNTGQSVWWRRGTVDADIDAPQAWEVSRGAGITVGLVDTGVDAGHPDLAGRIVPGHDFVEDDGDPQDGHGHGTHVAGTIAAGENGVGVIGVAGIRGNTLIVNCHAGPTNPQLIEVTPDKKVVWALYDWKNLGPATAVQMLDDPCIPEKPGDCQR